MKLIRIFFLGWMLFIVNTCLLAQDLRSDKDQKAVHEVLVKLFDGMREGDSAKVSSVFFRNVAMYTSFKDSQGVERIQKGELEAFLNAIGTPHDQVWDERIWNTKILVEGGIAQVWTQYAFYRDKDFSHCGVDAFHLVKDPEEGWQIVHLMDTRNKTGCEERHGQ